MTRVAALAECVILVQWLAIAWLLAGRFMRPRGFGLRIDFMWTEVVPALVAAAAVVGLGALLLRLQRLSGAAIGLRREGVESQVLWGVAAAVATYAVVFAWSWLSFFVRWLLWKSGHGHAAWLLRPSDPWARLDTNATVGSVLILWLAVAIGEEVLYRGLLLPRLHRVAGRWWVAVLGTSLVFGAGHLGGGLVYALAAFLMSVVWCLVFIRSRSLLAVVAGHFLYNSALYAQRCWLHGGR
jgi:membrane protease YdiL (CAAX protease family)